VVPQAYSFRFIFKLHSGVFLFCCILVVRTLRKRSKERIAWQISR